MPYLVRNSPELLKPPGMIDRLFMSAVEGALEPQPFARISDRPLDCTR